MTVLPTFVLDLARAVEAAGGRLYLVGGWVRDLKLGRVSKDLDFECHELPPDQLRSVLRRFGPAKAVGRSFGIFKLRVSGEELDVALPRGDAQPEGPPQVSGDPFMGVEAASRRRDLTINAMLYDPLTGQIIDPHGGLDDLAAGRLREVDQDTFLQDPHRAIRAARFAVSLDFEVTDSLRAVCRRADLSEVPEERLRSELEKILLQSATPGRGARLLAEFGLLERVLGRSEAAPGWCEALDRAAAQPADGEGLDDGQRYALLFATWLSPLSPADAEAWLTRYRIRRVAKRLVKKQILAALAHLPEARGPALDDTALRRMADGVELWLLFGLLAALEPDGPAADYLDRARDLGVSEGPLPRLLTGADLSRIGVPPGPAFGRVLAGVREAQHRGEVRDAEQAIAAARALAERL